MDDHFYLGGSDQIPEPGRMEGESMKPTSHKKPIVLGVVNTCGMKSTNTNRKRRWDQPPQELKASTKKLCINDNVLTNESESPSALGVCNLDNVSEFSVESSSSVNIIDCKEETLTVKSIDRSDVEVSEMDDLIDQSETGVISLLSEEVPLVNVPNSRNVPLKPERTINTISDCVVTGKNCDILIEKTLEVEVSEPCKGDSNEESSSEHDRVVTIESESNVISSGIAKVEVKEVPSVEARTFISSMSDSLKQIQFYDGGDSNSDSDDIDDLNEPISKVIVKPSINTQLETHSSNDMAHTLKEIKICAPDDIEGNSSQVILNRPVIDDGCDNSILKSKSFVENYKISVNEVVLSEVHPPTNDNLPPVQNYEKVSDLLDVESNVDSNLRQTELSIDQETVNAAEKDSQNNETVLTSPNNENFPTKQLGNLNKNKAVITGITSENQLPIKLSVTDLVSQSQKLNAVVSKDISLVASSSCKQEQSIGESNPANIDIPFVLMESINHIPDKNDLLETKEAKTESKFTTYEEFANVAGVIKETHCEQDFSIPTEDLALEPKDSDNSSIKKEDALESSDGSQLGKKLSLEIKVDQITEQPHGFRTTVIGKSIDKQNIILDEKVESTKEAAGSISDEMVLGGSTSASYMTDISLTDIPLPNSPNHGQHNDIVINDSNHSFLKNNLGNVIQKSGECSNCEGKMFVGESTTSNMDLKIIKTVNLVDAGEETLIDVEPTGVDPILMEVILDPNEKSSSSEDNEVNLSVSLVSEGLEDITKGTQEISVETKTIEHSLINKVNRNVQISASEFMLDSTEIVTVDPNKPFKEDVPLINEDLSVDSDNIQTDNNLMSEIDNYIDNSELEKPLFEDKSFKISSDESNDEESKTTYETAKTVSDDQDKEDSDNAEVKRDRLIVRELNKEEAEETMESVYFDANQKEEIIEDIGEQIENSDGEKIELNFTLSPSLSYGPICDQIAPETDKEPCDIAAAALERDEQSVLLLTAKQSKSKDSEHWKVDQAKDNESAETKKCLEKEDPSIKFTATKKKETESYKSLVGSSEKRNLDEILSEKQDDVIKSQISNEIHELNCSTEIKQSFAVESVVQSQEFDEFINNDNVSQKTETYSPLVSVLKKEVVDLNVSIGCQDWSGENKGGKVIAQHIEASPEFQEVELESCSRESSESENIKPIEQEKETEIVLAVQTISEPESIATFSEEFSSKERKIETSSTSQNLNLLKCLEAGDKLQDIKLNEKNIEGLSTIDTISASVKDSHNVQDVRKLESISHPEEKELSEHHQIQLSAVNPIERNDVNDSLGKVEIGKEDELNVDNEKNRDDSSRSEALKLSSMPALPDKTNELDVVEEVASDDPPESLLQNDITIKANAPANKTGTTEQGKSEIGDNNVTGSEEDSIMDDIDESICIQDDDSEVVIETYASDSVIDMNQETSMEVDEQFEDTKQLGKKKVEMEVDDFQTSLQSPVVLDEDSDSVQIIEPSFTNRGTIIQEQLGKKKTGAEVKITKELLVKCEDISQLIKSETKIKVSEKKDISVLSINVDQNVPESGNSVRREVVVPLLKTITNEQPKIEQETKKVPSQNTLTHLNELQRPPAQSNQKLEPITLRIYKDNLTIRTDGLDSPKKNRSPILTGELKSQLSPHLKGSPSRSSLSPQNKQLEFTLKIAKDANTNYPKATMSPKSSMSPSASIWKADVSGSTGCKESYSPGRGSPTSESTLNKLKLKICKPNESVEPSSESGGYSTSSGDAKATTSVKCLESPVSDKPLEISAHKLQEFRTPKSQLKLESMFKKMLGNQDTPLNTSTVGNISVQSEVDGELVEGVPDQPLPLPVTPTPRKRGRPRKVLPPMLAKALEEHQAALADPNNSLHHSFHVPESSSSLLSDSANMHRPMRSCRGRTKPIVVRTRKPRGGGVMRGGARGRGITRITPDRETLTDYEKAELAKIEEKKERLRAESIARYEAKKAKKLAKKLKDEERRKRLAREKAEKAEAAAPQVFEEETRMSAPDNSGSRGHTPAPLRSTQADVAGEESQNSNTPSALNKRGRMEIPLDLEGKEIRVEQLAEYYWQGSELSMIQEQISLYLGVKSFKRKYPDLKRRPVEAEERTFLEDSGLVPKSMCDLGITAVSSAEVLDIMFHDFPERYEEFRKYVREKQAREVSSKQKALSNLRRDGSKIEPREQALEAVASWNANLNRERKEERRCALDLQTFTIHYPKTDRENMTRPTPKVGLYPVALIPGQFCDYYKECTPTELMYFPLNTVLYGPLKPNERQQGDVSEDGSGSDSDSSSSDESSDSSSESGDTSDELQEDVKCKICQTNNKLKESSTTEKEPLIQCADCKQTTHPSCQDFTEEMLPHLKKYEWVCIDCKKCLTCKTRGKIEKILCCDLCDRGHHVECLGIKKVPERWHCSVCAYCTLCGTRDPGASEWQHEYKKGEKGVRIYLRTLCASCCKML